jgi:UDP-N-acetylmuramate dehydrogenase
MVLDPGDSNACSAGSFFLNPVLTESEFRGLRHRWQALGGEGEIPGFPSAGTWKVPAAWLVERAGFEKGFRMGRAGVSTKHALALVNHGGTAADLLLLAETIVRRVYEVFGVSLEKEPVILQ